MYIYVYILYNTITIPYYWYSRTPLATLAEGYFHSIYSPFFRFTVEKPQKGLLEKKEMLCQQFECAT